jgi:aldose 1-epimerase
MAFEVRIEPARSSVHPGSTVVLLTDRATGSGAAVWPAHGFNCYRWHVPVEGERELLFTNPQFFDEERPTRGGIPVLFPFPNRIRDGRFAWAGKEYQLPLGDPAGKNAIHGFACRKPWRVVDQGADEASAWVTGEFQGAVDSPETRDQWPADYRLRLTCRLASNRLRLEALVENPDQVPLPFGLGYHPYFRVPLMSDEETYVHVPAQSYWELQDSLPNGIRDAAQGMRDLTKPRPLHELQLDDVLTDLDTEVQSGTDSLCRRGQIESRGGALRVQLLASPAFREVVAFTPPHRQAVCLEPYTCTTDAINLQQRGVNAGLRVLAPGEQWVGVVEMAVSAPSPR